MATVLVWNATLPHLNAFERFYDRAIGRRGQKPRMESAPALQRIPQGMAVTFMAATGLSLAFSWLIAAYIFEFFLIVALTALIAGKFCRGYCIYHILQGCSDFADATCPWSK